VALALAHDSKSLAAATRGTVEVWDLATGKSKRGHYNQGDVGFLSFSPDGKSLALAGDWLAGPKILDLPSRVRHQLAPDIPVRPLANPPAFITLNGALVHALTFSKD